MILHHAPSGSGGVFIAVPAYGQVPPLFAFSLYKSQQALFQAGIRAELAVLTGNCHVDDARNKLVTTFLESTCDDFVFIDSDLGWQGSDLVRLVQYDRDVVGGSYPLKQREEGFPVRFLPGEIWSDRDGLIEVDGLPTGFLRIKRHVLQTLFDKATKYRVKGSGDQGEMALIFERSIVGGGRVSGDYTFCRKWRGLGGKIYLAPDFYMDHVGENIWSGSCASFLRRKNGLALKQGLEKVKSNTADAKAYLEMVLEWGNDPYSGGVELLAASADLARLGGPILECGSGLTTLVMAAANPEAEIHALESDDLWLAKLRDAVARLQIKNVRLYRAPLVDRWYAPVKLPWSDFRGVLCDGPKRSDGDREKLLSAMDKNGCKPKVILVDDAATEGFCPEGYSSELRGKQRLFAVLREL